MSKPNFQKRVDEWMNKAFTTEYNRDPVERNHRFLEEALELVQANDCSESEAYQLVDYVYNRPKGELKQEIGGVIVTLSAFCSALDIDMDECGETELKRIWTRIEKIRTKQNAKPKFVKRRFHKHTVNLVKFIVSAAIFVSIPFIVYLVLHLLHAPGADVPLF